MLFSQIKSLNNLQVDSSPIRETTSYLSETLEMSLRFNEDWFNLRSKMMRLEHHALVSENTSLLNEGAKDFFSKIKGFFVKLWDGIKNLWSKFTSAIHRQFLNDKEFVNKYQDKLSKVSIKDYSYYGYSYSITAATPQINPDLDFLTDDTHFSGNFGDIDTVNVSKIKHHYLQSFDESYFDRIRGKVINKAPINDDDFKDELIKAFRSGSDSSSSISMNSSLLQSMMTSLSTSKEDIDSCEKLKKDMDKFYQTVILYFDKMVTIDGTSRVDIQGYTHSNNTFKTGAVTKSAQTSTVEDHQRVVEALHELARIKSEQARKVSLIFNLAFSAKLDALQERRKEYRKVLNNLLSRKAS